MKRFLALILAAHTAALSPLYGATTIVNSYRFASGGGVPTLVISDDFPYFGDLVAQSAGAWTYTVGAINCAAHFTGNDAGLAIAYHTTAVSANHRGEITVPALGVTDYTGCAVRVQVGGDNYHVIVRSGEILLRQYISGTPTTIQTSATAFSAGDKISLQASGAGASARLKVQKDVGAGWVDIWSSENPPNDLDGGSVGIATFANSGNTTGDAFRAYNLP
jgi:hypothetical protein